MASPCPLDDMVPANAALWGAVADEIEDIAARVAVRARNPRLGEIVQALGAHTARELSACAAELRANIALLEAVPCPK